MSVYDYKITELSKCFADMCSITEFKRKVFMLFVEVFSPKRNVSTSILQEGTPFVNKI